MRRLWFVLVCATAGLEGVYLALARLVDWRLHAAAFLWWAGGAVVLYLGVVAYLRRVIRTERVLLQSSAASWVVFFIVAAAALFRLTVFLVPPTLSDDVYRYLWDGRVQMAGINPYRYAPSDPALAGLRTGDWTRINHPDIPTIYPPLTQLAFRVGAMIAPTILMQKAVCLALEFALIGVLVIGLPRMGVSPLMSVVYAWHPLAVIEVAGSGHNDSLGIVALMVALLLWAQRRPVWSGVLAAVSFLSKFATILWLPFYAVRARGSLAIMIGIMAIAAAWCQCSPHFTPGLGHYARHWEFNSSLYSVLLWVMRDPLWTRLLALLIIGIVGIVLARRGDDLAGYALVMLQAVIVLAPVVEPWYLLWVLSLLCVRFSWMWTVFAGLVLLSYAVLIGYVQHGVWVVPMWVKLAEYGPLYGWLSWRAFQRLRTHSPAGGRVSRRVRSYAC